MRARPAADYVQPNPDVAAASTALRVPGVESAEVVLVWDPPWSQARMSDEARLELGLL